MYSASYRLFIGFCVCDFRNSGQTNAEGQTWGCFDLHYLCLYLNIAYRYI